MYSHDLPLRGIGLKYSDSLPAFVDCRKDSESTGHSGWIQAFGLSVRQNKVKVGFDLGTFRLWDQNTTIRPAGQTHPSVQN